MVVYWAEPGWRQGGPEGRSFLEVMTLELSLERQAGAVQADGGNSPSTE